MHEWGRWQMGKLYTSPQLCCEPKTALKRVLIKKKKKITHTLLTYLKDSVQCLRDPEVFQIPVIQF